MLAVVAALLGSVIAAPHRLSLDLGVPVPLSVYGYRSKDGARGLVWLGAVGLEYRHRVAGHVDVGAWVSAANVHGKGGDATADVYFVSSGLLGAYELPLGTGEHVSTLIFVLGLGVMWSGIAVDDGIGLRTTSIGSLGRIRFSWPMSPHIALGLSTSFELFSAPLNRETWFNTELKETFVLGIALGVTAAWGD